MQNRRSPPGRQATDLKDFAALKANAFKTNAAGKAASNKKTRPHRRVFSGGIRRAEERTKARTARQGSRDEDGCARDGASGRSVRPQGTTKEQRRLPDAGIVKGLAQAP
ncbi:hypothetical protein B7764_14200 [Pantoea ananatis]|nr:hypothetical protein B7764_14200 [Pantoea ananatis]